MSNLDITLLAPRTPYQTYLEERLQSAAGLGWRMPAADAHSPVQDPGARVSNPECVGVRPLAEPA